MIVRLVDDELSEPYNLYTYRYFLDDWCVELIDNVAESPAAVS